YPAPISIHCSFLSFLRLSLILFYFFFFFYCYVHHRDLHSFPTRRSSDLTIFEREQRLFNTPVKFLFVHALPGKHRDTGSSNGSRSEEHTSELQSRENLVCRLLLEKKKKKTLPKNNINNCNS